VNNLTREKAAQVVNEMATSFPVTAILIIAVIVILTKMYVSTSSSSESSSDKTDYDWGALRRAVPSVAVSMCLYIVFIVIATRVIGS